LKLIKTGDTKVVSKELAQGSIELPVFNREKEAIVIGFKVGLPTAAILVIASGRVLPVLLLFQRTRL